MSAKTWLPVLVAGLCASLAVGPAWGQTFFSGAYGGAGLAQTVVPFDTKDGNGNETTNAGVAEGPGGGVIVGYGRRNEDIYYGAEGSFGLYTASFQRESETDTDDLFVSARSSVAAAGRMGFIRTEQALLYGRLGWKQTRFEFDVGNDRDRTTLGGWLFGGGVEIPLLQVVNLRGEYTLVRYDSHDVDGTDKRIIPQERSIRIGAVYRF